MGLDIKYTCKFVQDLKLVWHSENWKMSDGLVT